MQLTGAVADGGHGNGQSKPLLAPARAERITVAAKARVNRLQQLVAFDRRRRCM